MTLESDGKDVHETSANMERQYVARAPRFPIEARMQYREGGETAWHEGTTVNISRSGVLFRADHVLDLRRVLEMRIAFPPELTGASETGVICWGPIVRHHPMLSADECPAMAASIFHYRFQHS